MRSIFLMPSDYLPVSKANGLYINEEEGYEPVSL